MSINFETEPSSARLATLFPFIFPRRASGGGDGVFSCWPTTKGRPASWLAGRPSAWASQRSADGWQ